MACAIVMFTTTAGCSHASRGAGTGAMLGALAGGIIGHQSGETGEGAAIGAAVGAGLGYVLGNEQDKQDHYYNDHYYGDGGSYGRSYEVREYHYRSRPRVRYHRRYYYCD